MLSFKMALRSIGANKLRAVLTMLGIIIGVMALVVLVSLVNGATSTVTDAVSGLGSSMLTVTVASVTGQDTMTLSIQVDETDILDLSIGQTARITVDAIMGQLFEATITDIGNTGSNNGGHSKFTVELQLPRAEQMLSGMNATARITLTTTADTPSVPVAALVEEGAQTILYTGYDEESGTLTDPVVVTLGVSDGENVQILSGLAHGATYYYAYYDTLFISNMPSMGGGSFFGR
ncbi:MAG: HlyD family efflux transporter periplasmic adaptor subunit [Ruminococcaceae bacterium]|nr:HlyD family efflux transporter periplasmic adaptor subunit [Oscillospiraceae bacterium]